MKNTLILILVFSLIFSGMTPLSVYGETVSEENLENIILRLKELFNISNDYDNFVSRVNSYNDQVNYYLDWSDSEQKLPSININVDSKGNIISYNKYDNEFVELESILPKISRDEALEIALAFIEKVDPIAFKEIELKDSSQPMTTWDRSYNFLFTRVIDDIPYNSNSINISVDMHSEEVSNLYINWTRDIEFPAKEGIISLDDAKEAYKEKIALKLVYKEKSRVWTMDSGQAEDSYFLAYSTLGALKGIEAISGEAINLTYYYPLYGEGTAAQDNAESGGGAPIITPEEQEEIDKLKGLKTIDEAEKEARNILDLDNSYELRGRNLYSSWNNQDDFFYSLSFTKNIDGRDYYTDISLNAKTLDLQSFYKGTFVDEKAKPQLDKNEALELAKDYLKKINPDKVNQVEYMELYNMEDNQQLYGFTFMRKVDDIYVESDTINIGVNAVNKDIYSYNINWFKGEFPASENIITVDEAYQVLFDQIGFALSYQDIYSYENNDNNIEIKLVYSINQDIPTIIDALTGDILDYSGNVYRDNTILTYTDIEDSYAKDWINTNRKE